MFIGAGIAAVAALVLFLVGRAQAAKAREITAAQTTTCAALADLQGKIAAEIGKGSFSEYAELKGKAAPERPLVAEFSGTECVWYECTVTREYEETYWETDKDGNRHQRTRRGSEQVSHVLREAPFLLEDESGKVLVDPAGAKIEAEKTYSGFDQGQGGSELRLGSFVLSLASMALGGRRTIGFRLEEKAIPVGARLYVLGEARDSSGTLTVARPIEKGRRFIVSVRSEEEIVRGAKTGATVLTVIAAGVAAAAVGLAIAGFVTGM